MKKVLSLALLALVFILPSCGSSQGNAESVNQKIEKGEQLSQEDYSVMLDYLTDAMTSAEHKLKEIGDDKEKLKDFETQMHKNYPYSETFMKNLSSAKDLDDANKKKLQELFAKAITISMQMSGR